MKLIKIGSSPSCDIVLSSPYVSSLHAELTLLNNGEIVIEDKNSRNGTTVGSRKIDPNVEVTVRRGDHIRLGDVDLPWGRVPSYSAAQEKGKYTQIINVGSNYRNDIVINSGVVSRYHATVKVGKDNKLYICDNGSRNGTQVNGVRIESSRDIRLNKGDNVVVAGEDITDQVMAFLPNSPWKKPLWISAAVAAVAILGVGIYFLVNTFLGPDINKANTAVVYVHTAYHYDVTVKTTLGDMTFRYPAEEIEDNELFCSGTGFFLDDEGRIGTARHVAVPWDKAYSEEEHAAAEAKVRNYLASVLSVGNVNSESDFNKLKKSDLGSTIIDRSSSLTQINAAIKSILGASIDIQGKVDYVVVGLPGCIYNNISDFKACTLVAESGDANKDVAIIQLNSKETPSSVKYTFDMSKVDDKALTPLKDNLTTIGYPHGLLWGLDKKDQTLQPNNRHTLCSKVPNKFNFEIQESSQGGASGSPVFKENGQLVGILSAVYEGDNGPTIASHAAFLKQLYFDNLRQIAK